MFAGYRDVWVPQTDSPTVQLMARLQRSPSSILGIRSPLSVLLLFILLNRQLSRRKLPWQLLRGWAEPQRLLSPSSALARGSLRAASVTAIIRWLARVAVKSGLGGTEAAGATAAARH